MKLTPLKAISMAIFALCLASLFITCKEKKSPPPAPDDAITAKPLPIIVPGFKFPEDSATILGWVNREYFDTVSIYKHAWGIWAGLTANSGEHYGDQKLLVYETWPGITDIQTMVNEGNTTDCPTRQGAAKLHAPRQDAHGLALLGVTETDGGKVDDNAGTWVTVNYDPTAACFATKNALLDSNILYAKRVANKITNIPAFPNTSVSIKPTFFVGKQTDSLVVIAAWPGPPPTGQWYGPSVWNSQVYVDVKNGQPAGKIAVPAPSSNPTPAQIAAATCNLSDFINFKVDAAAAAYINEQQNSEGDTAHAGDLAILVAMHVATKEISNWTWQTFFWSPDPANPPFPSDKVAASLRPKELVGAASHYAVSTAYAMVRPNQPIYNGTKTGVTAVIGYNPYLEPGLGAPIPPSTTPTPLNSPAPKGFPNQLNPNLKWGMQSNCMSCHALAAYAPYPATTPYTADQYISMNDPVFLGYVQVDFLWSIPNNMTSRAATKKK